MTPRPLTIRAHEAQAIQSGRLSLIVRPMKPQPDEDGLNANGWPITLEQCPLGKPGDDLWCRETLKTGYLPNILTGEPTNASIALYDVDDDWVCNEHGFNICPWWTGNRLPSCRMPRWASRFTLRVIEIDCKRVQEISEAEAICGGVEYISREAGFDGWRVAAHQYAPTARAAFSVIWDSDHGPGAWERNEWVWLVRVERVAG